MALASRLKQYGFEVTDEEEAAGGDVVELDDAYKAERKEFAVAERRAMSWERNRIDFDLAATLEKGRYVKAWKEKKPDLDEHRHRLRVLDAARKQRRQDFEHLLFVSSDLPKRLEESVWPLLRPTVEDEESMTVAQFRALKSAQPDLWEIVVHLMRGHARAQGGATPNELKELVQRLEDAQPGDSIPTLAVIREERRTEEQARKARAEAEAAERRRQESADAALYARYRNPKPQEASE